MRFLFFASACALVASTNPCQSDALNVVLPPSPTLDFHEYDLHSHNFGLGSNGFAWRFLNPVADDEPTIMCFIFPDGIVRESLSSTKVVGAVGSVLREAQVGNSGSALLEGYEGLFDKGQKKAEQGRMRVKHEINAHDAECERDGELIGEVHGYIDLRRACKALGVISNAIFAELTKKSRFRSVQQHIPEHHCTHLDSPIHLSIPGEVELYVKGFELSVERGDTNPDYMCFDLSRKSSDYRQCVQSNHVTQEPCEGTRSRIIEALGKALHTYENLPLAIGDLLGNPVVRNPVETGADDVQSIHAVPVERRNHSYHTWDCMDGKNMIFVQMVYNGRAMAEKDVVQHCEQLKHVYDAFSN